MNFEAARTPTYTSQPRQFETLNNTAGRDQLHASNELIDRNRAGPAIHNMSARPGGFNISDNMSQQSTPSRSIASSLAPLDLPYKVEKQVQLNGVNIFITLDANSDRLSLFVQEQKKLMWAWKAEFNSQYLEEITRKTGKPMSYEQFISMLNHCLNA